MICPLSTFACTRSPRLCFLSRTLIPFTPPPVRRSTLDPTREPLIPEVLDPTAVTQHSNEWLFGNSVRASSSLRPNATAHSPTVNQEQILAKMDIFHALNFCKQALSGGRNASLTPDMSIIIHTGVNKWVHSKLGRGIQSQFSRMNDHLI